MTKCKDFVRLKICSEKVWWILLCRKEASFLEKRALFFEKKGPLFRAKQRCFSIPLIYSRLGNWCFSALKITISEPNL